ncbi:Hypothetical protein CINCED_3A015646 [Cinara cedri]|uniref:Uncharacterized protein n=1 Tax=Cinara cedri TaxID=506608 RepID=A0A5E4NK01_9HEMI|nr:Hypothetical protein CINCED_3A015646 [Cinara cedri]
MEMDEEIIYADEEELSSSYYESVTGFIQNNGWYFVAFIILLAYLVPKVWPHYLKWSERRAEAAYDAEVKKNPDLFKLKQEELKNARVKFQEEYEKKAKIALEKQKEVKLVITHLFHFNLC